MIVPKPFESSVRRIILSGLSWLNARTPAEEQGEIEAARDWLRSNLTNANGEQMLDGAKAKTQTFSKLQGLEDAARLQDAAKEIQRGEYDLPDLPGETR